MKGLWFPEKAHKCFDKVSYGPRGRCPETLPHNWLLFRARFFVFGPEQLT
jgi:hypothetical protein